jgi:hypothetical protein
LLRSDYRRFARPTYRQPSVRLSHDADCRNAIKRSSISQLRRSLALNGLQFRKDIELLRCDFHSAASHSEAQRLCPPFSEMQSSRIVPLASAPAGCAVPYSTTRDHCGALKTLSRNISNSALSLAAPCQGFATRRLCVPFSPAQTPSLFFGDVIICAVLTVLSAAPIPHSHSESRTPRCGCADHHGIAQRKSNLRHA